MKRLSAVATAIALALAFAGPASATESLAVLSEAQLDAVVAGTATQGAHHGKDPAKDVHRGKDYTQSKGPGHGKRRDIASGGIGGTGIVALAK